MHPLPPKPRIPITGSSYRPGRKRGRSRTSNRSGDSLSRSRSHSQGREARRARSPSRSKSRQRDSPVDRQPQDKQTKPSAPDSNADNGGVAQSKQERTPNEARPPLPPQPRAIVNGNAAWPTTSPSRESPILGWTDDRVPVQQLVFSSDGKKLAMIGGCLVKK